MIAARGLVRVALMVALVIWLSGCMRALQTGQSATMTVSPPFPDEAATVEHPTSSPVATGVSQGEPSPQAPAPTETEEAEAPPTVDRQTVAATQEPTMLASDTPTPGISPTATPTLSPTLSPTPTATPTPQLPTATPTPDITIVPPTLPPVTYEERWRLQQREREVFDKPRSYTTSGSTLWWYDPVNQQHVALGSFSGDFVAQSQFSLPGKDETALEVPYHINESYGLTSISPALLERIEEVGYDGEWIETYVLLTPQVQPQ